MQKTLQDLHIMHERNESENIPILVEERGDAFWGIPKLRRLSLLEYLLGVPRASLSLSSCLSSFSSYRDILDQTLHPHKTSTENSVRSVSIIKQITTFRYCCKLIPIPYQNYIYCIPTSPWFIPPDTTHRFIKISKQHTKKQNLSKTGQSVVI